MAFALLAFVSCVFAGPAIAGAPAVPADALDDAVAFFGWLEGHAKDFGRCEPRKDGDAYVLCDGTRVGVGLLKELFAKSPGELAEWVKGRGLKIEALCDAASGKGMPSAGKAAVAVGPFAGDCSAHSSRGAFRTMTALHGQYLAEERTILIRSTASPGSLIHEYLHSLEADNERPVFGHVYKRERLAVQKGLTQAIDAEIALVKRAEARGDAKGAVTHAKAGAVASQLLAHFGLWQDLIDERSLFRLYVIYGSEFGAAPADLELARKNMGFICARKELRPVLPGADCVE